MTLVLITQAEKYQFNFDDIEMSVCLNEDPNIKSQVRWDDMAGMIYPARTRK
jgi:hypothetical protein